jgi:two-component system CheB/CheR fusion protein
MGRLFGVLLNQTGHDFSGYKGSTVRRRVERRMAAQRTPSLGEYVELLEERPSEVEALLGDLLIGVTQFFRDPEVFETLGAKVFPGLLEGKAAGESVRVWVPGCSTGEEAYSLAILLQEHLDRTGARLRLQVFATDIDRRAIHQARTGVYPAKIAEDIAPGRLAKFFEYREASDSYRICNLIRENLVFSEQDVLKDPPFSRLDFISCRNLLIYLGPELQSRMMSLFHFALKPEGVLFLGQSETVGRGLGLFSVLDRSCKLYRPKQTNTRLRPAPRGTAMTSPVPSSGSGAPGPTSVEPKSRMRELAERTLLQHHGPVGILVTEAGDITYLHGRSGLYLEPAPGEACASNVLGMAREGLKEELAIALHKAAKFKQVVHRQQLRIKTNGEFTLANLSVRPVPVEPDLATEPALFLITLDPVLTAEGTLAHAPHLSGKEEGEGADTSIARLREELRLKEDYLQSANEELETANEELKSSIEELQSVNEELNSANEELTIVNGELSTKVLDLSQANNDASNLLAGTGAGTIFLDQQGLIRRYTPEATRLFHLIPADMGRPLGHVVPKFAGYPDLEQDVLKVLETQATTSVQVKTRGEAWYLLRILPYRTLEGVREGAVISIVDISEIRHTQDELRRSERQFSDMVLNSPGVVYQFFARRDGTVGFHYVSPKAEEIFGLSRDVNSSDWDLAARVHPDDRDAFLASIAQAIAEAAPWNFEGRLVTPKGTLWFQALSRPTVLPQEIVFNGIMVDITERKTLEAHAQNEREALEVLAKGGPLPEVLASLVKVFERALPGVTGSVLLLDAAGRSLHHGASPNLPPEFSQAIDGAEIGPSAGSCGTSAFMGAPVLVADLAQDPRWSEHKHLALAHGLRSCWSVPIFGVPGQVLGTLAFYFRSPREAQPLDREFIERGAYLASLAIQRHRAEESLRESEGRFQLAMEAVSDGVWDRNLETGQRFFNSTYARMVGYEPEEFAQRASRWIELVHPEDRERLLALNEACVEGVLDTFSMEYRFITRDGAVKWVLGRGRAARRDAKGRALRMIGTNVDITSQRTAEAERAKLQAHLMKAQKMDSLGSLAGGVAHDLNNVLGAILALASANLEAQPAESPVHQAFSTISQAATRGGKVIKSLLSFARQSPAEERELDLNEVLREEARMLERTTLAKVRVEMELACDLGAIRGDASALTHAFMNLCINAVDAMPENGTLTLRTFNVDPDWIEVQVEDTGTGMTREVLEKALDPFFTTKGVGKGTGLGLSIVYRTVEAHRGRMEIQSEPGKGTRVSIRFPSCGGGLRAHERSEAPAGEVRRQVLEVLVVDDDELMQSGLRTLLGMMGHKATVACRGEEALGMLAAGFRPDAIILDINMPGLGGEGTLPAMRALDPAVPILLATGRVDQAAMDLANRQPHVALLPKPFTMEELRRHLETL